MGCVLVDITTIRMGYHMLRAKILSKRLAISLLLEPK